MNVIPSNISRKGLASIVNLSTDQIRKEEKKIGLDKIRVRFNRHAVLYRTVEALEIFKLRGFSVPRLVFINELLVFRSSEPEPPQQSTLATMTR